MAYYTNNKVDGVDYMAEADLEAIETGFASVEADILKADVAESITSLWNFIDSGTGGATDYDLTVGDVDGTPTYGIIRIGNSIIGRTSNTAGYDLDGAFVIRNSGGAVSGNIEFAVIDSASLIRFATPKSGVGNATYSPRSMLIAGPAVADSDIVTVGYWQTEGIFGNLVCDTGTNGADLGVQNDLEVEGDIFVDSIKESTASAGVTIEGVSFEDNIGSNLTRLLYSNNNIMLGQNAGVLIDTGINNTAIGNGSGTYLSTGSDNIFMGHNAGLGTNAVKITGGNNIFLGGYSGKTVTSGGANICLGQSSGSNITTGSGNIFFGLQAGLGNVAAPITGGYNIAIGGSAGTNLEGAANDNILIGQWAGDNITTGDDNIIFGKSIDSPSATGDDFLSIGNLIFATGGFGTGTTVGAGKIGIKEPAPETELEVAGTITCAPASGDHGIVLSDEDWDTTTLTNGKFRKFPDGVVEIRATASSTISGTLPSGYRPSEQIEFSFGASTYIRLTSGGLIDNTPGTSTSVMVGRFYADGS